MNKPRLVKRSGLVALLMVLVMLLASCGGTATPTSGTGAGAGTDTTPTAGSASAAPTDTAPAAGGESTPAAGGVVTGGGATPVSDWKPGKYAKSIPAPSKLVSAGTLTFGSDASYPPQEYIDPSGKAVGMDIDIAEEIASRMGLNLKVVNFKFDDIIPALNAGQFDAVVSAMTITDERKKVVDFVQYFEAGQAILVKKGNPAGIKSLDDLSGKTAVAQQGTVEEDTLKTLNDKLKTAGKPEVKVLTYPTDTDAVDQLRVGRADATLHDSPVAAYYAKLNPQFEVAVPNFEAAPQGVAVAKTNKPMYDAINSAMDAMMKDGTIDAIKGKWGVK